MVKIYWSNQKKRTEPSRFGSVPKSNRFGFTKISKNLTEPTDAHTYFGVI